MKRIIVGALIAFAMVSCGGEAEAPAAEVPAVDTAAVVELENATQAVETGLEELQKNVDQLNTDVDSLLNGI